MIQEALKFLVGELNQFFSVKLGASTELRVVLGNVARAFDNDNSGGVNNTIAGKVVVSMVNLEEDRVSKQTENFVRTPGGVIYRNPPVPLNLYVLFSINRNDYSDCLKWLSLVVQFFQHQSVFTPQTHVLLNPGISKLIVELNNMSFEQVNHLWGTLGGKYLPSVLYKIRQVTVDEGAITGEGPLIKEVIISSATKNQSS